jgi:predicted RNase H-like HicB family nuclease
MNLAYRVILEPEPDKSAYNVIIPAFPKAHTFGRTIEEALANARELIELEIEDRTECAQSVPPSDATSP